MNGEATKNNSERKHMINSSGQSRLLSTLAISACVVLMVYSVANNALAQMQGQFEGDLVLKALPDGRNMQLVHPFNYIDSRNVPWPVPAGTIVDGASIPRVFWSIVGAPYTGKYRDASVIHDYYCETHSRHWKAVHKVFYDGMLARGVNPFRPKSCIWLFIVSAHAGTMMLTLVFARGVLHAPIRRSRKSSHTNQNITSGTSTF